MPCSLARTPYDTVIEGSTRAVAVARAGSLPSSPVYHVTVSAGVPATRPVAVSNGGPPTRWGGWVESTLKKSLAAVAAADAPMVNWFGPGLADAVAVRVRVSLVPSGIVKRYSMVSPSFGV